MDGSTLKKMMGWILVGSLLLAAACSTGSVQVNNSTSYPTYKYQQEDPQFWQMWQNRYGGG
jgi:outer membrane biogenesis lipoprotein LolB